MASTERPSPVPTRCTLPYCTFASQGRGPSSAVLFLQLGELLQTAPRQRRTPHVLNSLVQPAHFAEIGHPLTTFMWCSHRYTTSSLNRPSFNNRTTSVSRLVTLKTTLLASCKALFYALNLLEQSLNVNQLIATRKVAFREVQGINNKLTSHPKPIRDVVLS